MESPENPPGSETTSVVAMRAFAPVAAQFAAGQLRPSDELKIMLERIERFESAIQAFAVLSIEAALCAAAASDDRWRKRAPLSAIDGMVVGVKDIIETRDMPTGQG